MADASDYFDGNCPICGQWYQWCWISEGPDDVNAIMCENGHVVCNKHLTKPYKKWTKEEKIKIMLEKDKYFKKEYESNKSLFDDGDEEVEEWFEQFVIEFSTDYPANLCPVCKKVEKGKVFLSQIPAENILELIKLDCPAQWQVIQTYISKSCGSVRGFNKLLERARKNAAEREKALEEREKADA